MKLKIGSEVGILRDVVLGTVGNFVLHTPINATQRYYYHKSPPQIDLLTRQQEEFVKVLERFKVNIHWVEPQTNSPLQVFTRDIATVISEEIVVCLMKEPIRAQEPESIEILLSMFENPITFVDEGVLEGGDIILSENDLYVGLGERSNVAGLKWIEKKFGNIYNIFPIELQPPFLHLDVVFNLIGRGFALAYSPGIHENSLSMLRKQFKIIEVTQEEQFNLATNLLAISPEIVISDRKHKRLNTLMQEFGLEVKELDYSEITKLGGGFRCSTFPILRD